MPAIQYTTSRPAIDQFWQLFLTTGWNDEYHLAPDDLSRALEHSWHMVCAYERERLIGFGRVVSDTSLHAMIYDLIVDPDYRQRGIGGYILEQLVERCLEEKIRDIQLFCARGKRAFYEKRGFSARPEDGPGMSYRPERIHQSA